MRCDDFITRWTFMFNCFLLSPYAYNGHNTYIYINMYIDDKTNYDMQIIP